MLQEAKSGTRVTTRNEEGSRRTDIRLAYLEGYPARCAPRVRRWTGRARELRPDVGTSIDSAAGEPTSWRAECHER